MYEKVSSENPEAPGPYEALGYLEYRLGDKDQARIQFGRAFELGSENPRVLRLYAGLQREADDETIVLTLLRAVEASPEDIDTRLALGSQLLQRDSYMHAVAILQQVRNANVEQARRALRMLVHARLKLNQRESGRRAATQLLELAQTPEEINSAQRLLALLEPGPADVDEDGTLRRAGPSDESGERGAGRIPAEIPVSRRGPAKPKPREETRVVAGSFVRLDCLGGQARMEVAVDGDTVSLLIDDGRSVDLKGSSGASVDLHCGQQRPTSVVVRFLPSENTVLGTRGVVRTIEFTGPAN